MDSTPIDPSLVDALMDSLAHLQGVEDLRARARRAISPFRLDCLQGVRRQRRIKANNTREQYCL